MNIKRAKQEIKDAVQAYLMKDEYGEYQIPAIHQRPILLMGPPGIGKTQIMEQISRECEIGLVAYTITHHTRQSAIGLPFIQTKVYGGKEYSVTEYTMSEIIAAVYEKIEQSGMKEGILFIDEINCVSETLAPTMLQFLQCKMFGNQKVPDGWIIVAAGNPPEYNKSVRDFDVVTLDRMKKIGLMWKPILTSGRNMLIRWESIRRYFLIWNFEKRISTAWKIQWMGKCLSQPEAGRIYQGCSRSMRSLVKRWTVRLCISISSIGKRRRILQIIWSCIRSIRRSMDWSGSLPDIMKQIRWNA